MAEKDRLAKKLFPDDWVAKAARHTLNELIQIDGYVQEYEDMMGEGLEIEEPIFELVEEEQEEDDFFVLEGIALTGFPRGKPCEVDSFSDERTFFKHAATYGHLFLSERACADEQVLVSYLLSTSGSAVCVIMAEGKQFYYYKNQVWQSPPLEDISSFFRYFSRHSHLTYRWDVHGLLDPSTMSMSSRSRTEYLFTQSKELPAAFLSLYARLNHRGLNLKARQVGVPEAAYTQLHTYHTWCDADPFGKYSSVINFFQGVIRAVYFANKMKVDDSLLPPDDWGYIFAVNYKGSPDSKQDLMHSIYVMDKDGFVFSMCNSLARSIITDKYT